MSELMLDVDQAGELKAAFRRGDWTNAQIKRLSEGDLLAWVLLVLEGRAEIVIKKVEEKIVPPLLQFIKIVKQVAVKGKKTSNCFTNKLRYYYREANLDDWLPKSQPDQAESGYSVRALTRPATFKEVVESYLGITGDVVTLSSALKERKLTTILPAVEALIERQEGGEDVGLWTNGWANFFFVEDKDGGVSVVRVRRDGSRWNVSVFRLGNEDRWDAGRRFFFRN